eukprot:g5104.t1
MLGNFSFGDYFKASAIEWAWELSTKEFGLPESRIWVSVFEEDDEAFALWTQYLPHARILRMGKTDNFWATGPTGPCGPCSELYYDFHPDRGLQNVDLNDDSRFIEFYNLVFMEMNRSADGSFTELQNKNIDTGMGLERMAQILQKVQNNYETDLLFPIIEKAAQMASVNYSTCSEEQKRDLKVIGDHIRAVTYLISDGIVPSNLGRGYILRRLIRRIIMKGCLLGIEDAFTDILCDIAIRLSTGCDSNVAKQEYRILSIVSQEEEQFSRTLSAGQKKLAEFLLEAQQGSGTITGQQAFMLFDTFGFPLEITEEISKTNDIKVDVDGFNEEMAQQKERSKSARKELDLTEEDDDLLAALNRIPSTEFLGYSTLTSHGTVLALLQNGQLVNRVTCENGSPSEFEMVLDKSPFYAESGGQIGDQGRVQVLSSSPVSEMQILDVQNFQTNELALHKTVLVFGEVRVQDSVILEVDGLKRKQIMCHHTSTHLLQSAIKKILGHEVCQQGSLVSDDRLRFDFNFSKALSRNQISEIEKFVNLWITQNRPLTTKLMELEEAKSAGAIAMFGEKYKQQVRVVDVEGVSMELCGGTHVSNTSELLAFKVISESAIQSGIRRIEAVAGPAAIQRFFTLSDVFSEVRNSLKVDLEQIPVRVQELQKEVISNTKQIESLQKEVAILKAETLLSEVEKVAECSLLVMEMDGAEGKILQTAAEHLLEKITDPAAIVLGASTEDRVSFAVAFSPALIKKKLHAGKFVSAVAQICGGRGGGRPNLAQAGGKDPTKFQEALQYAKNELITHIKKNEVDAEEQNTSEEELIEVEQESSRQMAPLPDRNQENISLQCLFDCVRRNPVAINQSAKLWIQNYKLNKEACLAELLSFFIRGAGCYQEFSLEDIQSELLPQTIQNLIRRAAEMPDEDPFRMKRGRKAFKSHYGLMWSEIVKESNTAALAFDPELVFFLSKTIIEFSKSVVRSLRFVACFVCSCVSHGWVQILNAKIESRSTTELQLNNEQRKRQNKVTLNRRFHEHFPATQITHRKIESLKSTLAMYQKQISDLEAMIGALFNEVLVHRFRDVCESVRSTVTETIAQWCHTLPSSFLNDQYLKYIAWPLSDKDNIVRLAAVNGLIQLYEKSENVLTLHEFSVRFQSRICEMVYDVDEAVAIGALKLLTKLVHHGKLPITEIKHIYKILSDDSVALRNAVADLLCELLRENAKQRSSSDPVFDSEDKCILSGVVNIFCELANEQDSEVMQDDLDRSWTGIQISTEHSLPIKTIKEFLSPLFDRLAELRNWELLTEQLNYSRTQGDINDGWFLMYIKILDCCVQLTHSGSKERTIQKSRKPENEEKQKDEMTVSLMEWLVTWINEFQTDGEKVVCFIRMFRHMKTELFILKSMTSSFVGILHNIMEVCFKHHQTLIGPQELRTVSMDFLKTTSDRIVQELTDLVPAVVNQLDNENHYVTLSVTLERVKHLLIVEQHELVDTVKLTHSLSEILEICSENTHFTEQFGVHLSQCGFLLILWNLVPQQDSQFALNPLQSQIQSCLQVTLSTSEKCETRWEASCLLVDLYLMLGHNDIPSGLSRVHPEDWMFNDLWILLQEKLLMEKTKTDELIQDLVVIGKLVTYGNLVTDQLRWIASQFFSLITHSKPAVVELVKKVARQLRKLNPLLLADVYLKAMYDRFDQVSAGHESIESFTNLSQRIANSYLVFNNTLEQSRTHVFQFVQEGICRATQLGEIKIEFITQGLSCFTPKLPKESIPQLIRALETLQNVVSLDQWNSLKSYIHSLEGRVKRIVRADQSPMVHSNEVGDNQMVSKTRTPFTALPVESASTSEGEEVQIGEIEELESLHESISPPKRRLKTSIGARVSLSEDEESSRKKQKL